MKNKILEVKNLSVLIKERFLVKNASFSMEKGQVTALIGEDRSGKTSLIKAITGSLPITEGEVFVDGKNVKLEPKTLLNVGICLDPPVFFKYQSVYENLSYLSKFGEGTNKAKIMNALKKFGLADKAKYKVLLLSYYEKKLMALALAFLTEPKILLLDEPFKALPENLTNAIKDHIRELQSHGTAVVVSTKNLESVEDISDQMIFMEDRQISKILSNKQCDEYLSDKDYAFVAVKYPHYAGKIIRDNFEMKVKLLGNKVLFEGDENTITKVVKFLTQNRIILFRAGFLNKKAEKILAALTPYYKEEN